MNARQRLGLLLAVWCMNGFMNLTTSVQPLPPSAWVYLLLATLGAGLFYLDERSPHAK